VYEKEPRPLFASFSLPPLRTRPLSVPDEKSTVWKLSG
jgi:hypothetical protein